MTEPNFTELLHNLATELPALARLLAALMYLAGIIFMFRGVYALKQFGELRTMMSVNASLKAPMLYLGIGALFLFYPTLISTSLTSIYASSNLLSYQTNPNWSSQANQAVQDTGMVLRFIGYVAFFRGWLIMSHLGNQGAPPGTFAKGLLHIISGILLVNIFGTWDIIETTLGIGGSN